MCIRDRVGTIEIKMIGLAINLGPQGPLTSILFGAVVSGILGLVVGQLSIRRQGIYFAMVTLALSQMVYFFCLQAPFTHGEDGIQGVPQGKLFGLVDLSNQMNMYFFVLLVFLGSFLLIHRIINSPFGEIMKSIRENCLLYTSRCV